MKQFVKLLISWLLYPLTMIFSVLIFFTVSNQHPERTELAVTYALLFSIFIIFIFERWLPYNKSWVPKINDWKTDGIYLLFVQTILPKLLTFIAAILAIRLFSFIPSVSIWPKHWSILNQAILVTFISDFFRYWLHRWNHTIPFLWRFHAVHHSVEKLYWMNTSRFHPIEKFMQFLMDVIPFLLLGVSPKVLALHLVLYGVNGFFQHCNIQLQFGWLNYLVSSSDLHRWHHSQKIEESNHNYGNNIILWDVLFGSFYWPKNRNVSRIGLLNEEYPQNFSDQLTAPLIQDIDKKNKPVIGIIDLFINWGIRRKVSSLKKSLYNDFEHDVLHFQNVQENVLMTFLASNKNTVIGKKYHFETIKNVEDYLNKVPIQQYEDFRALIMQQAASPNSFSFVQDPFMMFNKTSGSTAEPKLIPVTEQTFNHLQQSQQISLVIQYQWVPEAYQGKILGIVSPSIDSMTEYDIPIGSASGHFYKNMPKIVKRKYVVPHRVFEIEHFEDKYYSILLLALQHKNITYIGTANPSTILKLNELLNTYKWDLLRDLKNKKIRSDRNIKSDIKKRIQNSLKPSKKRLVEIESIFTMNEYVTFKMLWPHVALLTSWSGGSCGIALSSALELLPSKTQVIDPGYLSSEFRGSITLNPKNQGGIPTFQHHFFEFIPTDAFENGDQKSLLLNQLELNHEYYVIITTDSGLVRYQMNDIIRIVGFHHQCPLIVFVQKGNGITNITGEKLHEGQALKALEQLKLPLAFAQILADETTFKYHVYLELAHPILLDKHALAEQLDLFIQLQNSEYQEKRKSNRLKPIQIQFLKNGTYDSIKKASVAKGQNESQFKTILLQYQSKYPFDLKQYIQE